MMGGMISQGFKFLTLIYVARRFSAGEFGMVVFALAVNAFINVVSNFGLPVFGTREVTKRAYVSSQLLRCIVLSRAFLSLAGTVLAVAILELVPIVTREELVLIAIFGLSNFVLAGFLDWVFQGLARQDVSAILNVIWQTSWLVFLVVGIRLGLGIIVVPIAMCLGALLATVSGYAWLRQTGQLVRERVVISLTRDSWDTLRAGAHLGVGTLLNTVLVWTDAIAVRLFWGNRVAGVYAAGSRPGNALVMLCGFFMLGAFPQLSRATSSQERFARCFQRAYNELALMYVPLSVWSIFYAREIIVFIFKGSDYLAAVLVFQIFQVAVIIMAFNNLYGTGALLSYDRDLAYRKVFRNGAAVFFFLCLILTRFVGMIGTAIAIAISQAILLVLFLRQGQELVRPRHLQAVLLPFLCSTVMVVACRLFVVRFWASILALILTYLILLVIRAKVILTEGFPRVA
jgi:O-antigen/teichoic acid export membrane protein